MREDIIIPIRTPVVIISDNWSDMIDRRAVFNPTYGTVINYSQKTVILDDSEKVIYATEVQLKNGNVVSVAGFKYDKTGIFDKNNFSELIKEEIEKIEKNIKETQLEIVNVESFSSRIPENAEFIKEFWEAQLASMKQSVKFLSKKKGRLEDLEKKVIRKLEKMNK